LPPSAACCGVASAAALAACADAHCPPRCRDTTANALSWALHALHHHPEVEQRLLREAAEVLGGASADAPRQQPVEAAGKAAAAAEGTGQAPGSQQQQQQQQQAGAGAGGLPCYEQVRHMKYAQAVLLETLRLHPSVPKQVKFALADDLLPDGTFVPAGGCVLYSSYIMGRSEPVWGADAEQFRPERWLAAEGGHTANSFQFPAFNAGPRICLGKGLAELEGVFALVGLLLRYRLQVVEGQEVVYMPTLTLPMKNGLLVRVSRREP
jgi:cytochrome P450